MTKTKIILVDDRRENILALANLIEAPDVEILSATSGNDALALLLENEIALAILDVQMPEMSGFEVARLMRLAERSRRIPIIFVTASQSSDAHIFEGYEKGAVDYLLKPLDAHVVRSKVRVFVDLDQKSKALQRKSEILEEKLVELKTMHEAAESANRAKSRFLANMSHEIRTPLGAVLGYADLLKFPAQSAEDRANCIAAIERNGHLLQKIIDDVLDLAKIEADRVEADLNEVSLVDVIADVRAVHSHRASAKNLAFVLKPSGKLPRTIYTDPTRLKQILNNVIGNAIKFTERGKIELTIEFVAAKAGGGNLRFVVSDTGCGLSPGEAGRLFQPFMQADSSTTRRYGGTGLGLVISKQLAELLGGDLILSESRPGAGSTFVLSISTGRIGQESLAPAEHILNPNTPADSRVRLLTRLDGLHVLVADDTPDNRLLIRGILTYAGATVDMVENGKEALQRATSNRYDAVLMDVQMPVMDGLEATAQLRQLGYKGPVIALTAHAMREDLERCLQVGCNLHMSKPIDAGRLLIAVRNLAKQDQERRAVK